MISEAELAQMKAWCGNYRAHADYVNDVPRLIREVEELTKENAGLREIGTRLLTIRDEKMKTIEELRAALRLVVRHWDEFGPEHGLDEVMDKARAALGSADE